MRRIKTKLAVLLVFAIVLSGINTGMNRANSENTLTVYGEAVTATAGKEIKIPIMLKDNHGVAGLALKATYDTTVMTPVKAEKGSLITSLSNLQFGDTIANHTENNFECVAYNDSNFTNNGELFVLTFKVADNATAGSHTLTLELTEHYDETLADIAAGCENITITVGNSAPTGTPDATDSPNTSTKPQPTATPGTSTKPQPTATPNTTKKKKRKVTKKPGRVKIKKIKNIGKGRAKVTWGKVNCNFIYVIQFSRKKNFSGATMDSVSKSKRTYTIKGNSKKTYYVRVRAWSHGYPSKYAEDKVHIRGKWSTVKKIKLK